MNDQGLSQDGLEISPFGGQSDRRFQIANGADLIAHRRLYPRQKHQGLGIGWPLSHNLLQNSHQFRTRQARRVGLTPLGKAAGKGLVWDTRRTNDAVSGDRHQGQDSGDDKDQAAGERCGLAGR